MTRQIITFAIILLSQTAFGQTKKENDKQEIKKVLNTFMKCLIQKDSTKFYSLFHTDPIVWVGVTQKNTFADELKKDSLAKDNFKANYKSFYRHFYNKAIEERFYNIQILNDDYIASVMFDYSFWSNGKKENWGKESWAMIKTNGQWKITSVIFSTEDETIIPEPQNRKTQKAK